MRLIDADRLLDAMKRSTGVFSPMVVKNLIDNSETVFDKDKVIEELKKAECSRNLETVAYRQKALEIVERGGAIDRIKAIEIVKIAEKYKTDKCKWTLIDEEANVYDTDCRNPHILTNGTPKDNGYSYCPYCGKEIEL